MGATLGAAFCGLAKVILPLPELSIPAFAIVGMAAMAFSVEHPRIIVNGTKDPVAFT
jgi:H+/Cl- antiporter ClcA